MNSKNLRNAVVITLVSLLAVGSVWAAKSKKPSTVGLLGSIPARSLFCVRINQLESTLGAANDFLRGITSESFDAKEKVFSKLGELLGDESLSGVSRKGSFAIFGIDVPGGSKGRGPMGNLFIGALIPVRKYEDFISGNPNCGQPDDEGISTITVDGKARGLATNLRRFALLCSPDARENLIRVKKLMAQRKQSLGMSLEPEERKLAASSPVWLYLNVKQGSELMQSLISGKLEQMKAQLQKMKEGGEDMMMDPSGILNFYAGIFKMLIEGTDHVVVGLSPASEACNVTVDVKPVPGTEMAAIVGDAISGNYENLLGYLEDGSMMNLGCKIDHKSIKTFYMKIFSLIGQITTEGIPEEDLEKLKKLTTKAIDALGDSLAISFGVGEQDSSPFSIKYVIKVRDQKAFTEVIEEQMQMMREGILNKLYKGFGMEMDFKVERDAGTYKGIGIDAAKVAFKMGDEKSPQSQMIQKIWGDGLNYRWAFVDGYCVYSIGGDADKAIRRLIDQVRAGGPKKIGSEMKAALEAIPNSGQADAVGTINYVRLLNLAFRFMSTGDASMPQFDVPSRSNIAFSGLTAGGKTTLQLVLPKKHLLELKAVIEKIEQQKKLERQKKKSMQS